MLGPRTFSTGDPLYSGDGARQNEITSLDIARQNVGRLQAWGAITIKQYGQPRREQRQWVTDAARDRGMRVTAEGGDLEYNLGMIMDGHTGWEHPMPFMPLYDDVAKFFGLAKAVYSGDVPGRRARAVERGILLPGLGRVARREAAPLHAVAHADSRHAPPHAASRDRLQLPLLARGVGDIVAHGGYGAIGSHGQQHGMGSHWEVQAARPAWATWARSEIATSHGAHFLGLDGELGTLTSGKVADVLVLTANPLDDIKNTTKIKYVVKNGIVWDASTLDEVWPNAKPHGDYPWVNPDALRTDDRPVTVFDKVTGSSH